MEWRGVERVEEKGRRLEIREERRGEENNLAHQKLKVT